jgi:hypothetical protein
MVAGLSVQVASLLLFMTLCFEFGWRAHKHHDQLNPKHASLYNSSRFKIFLWCKQPRPPLLLSPLNSRNTALALATMTIFTRSVFRVAELSGGFGGHLANDQVSYMILEGAMIAIASIALTVMHPGFGFGRKAWAEGDWSFRSRKGGMGEKNNGKGREEVNGAGADGSVRKE